MPVIPERRRRKEDGAGEFSIEAVAVGIAKVAGQVRFAVRPWPAEQPEEAGILVGRNRQAILTTRLGGGLSDGLPRLSLGTRAERLDPITQIAVGPGELNPSPLLDEP
jgi:hypothetical protein